jgi:hypothetical protein
MDSRIVIEADSRPGSFAPGSTAEERLRASEAGAKGLKIQVVAPNRKIIKFEGRRCKFKGFLKGGTTFWAPPWQ